MYFSSLCSLILTIYFYGNKKQIGAKASKYKFKRRRREKEIYFSSTTLVRAFSSRPSFDRLNWFRLVSEVHGREERVSRSILRSLKCYQAPLPIYFEENPFENVRFETKNKKYISNNFSSLFSTFFPLRRKNAREENFFRVRLF